MKYFSLAMILLLASAAQAADDPRVGLNEDGSSTDGWFEWDSNGNEISPRVKLESKDGLLHVHLNRGLLAFLRRHSTLVFCFYRLLLGGLVLGLAWYDIIR